MQEAYRVVLDSRKLSDAGIGVYIENLVEGLLSLLRREYLPFSLTLLVHPKLDAPKTPQEENARRLLERWGDQVAVVQEPAANYSFSEYFLLAERHRELLSNCHLYHSPHYVLPYLLRLPAVVTIHDAIHINSPATPFHRLLGRALIRSAISRARHVITVSSASLARLTRLVGATATPFTVIPNALRRGVGPASREAVTAFLAEKRLRAPYFLFVGSDRPHKGFRELLYAWRDVCAHDEEQLLLVVVGTRYSRGTRRLVERLGITERVIFNGEATVAELNLLYNGARAVVVPSREEGFGLVALEALACSTSLVCCPEPSLQEVAGNCAWYAEDFSPPALAQVILACARDPELREVKSTRGRMRALEFDRETTARRTLDVYLESLCRKSSKGEEVLSYGKGEVFDQHLRRAL